MKEVKTTLIKPKRIKEKEQDRLKIISPIILLIVGIILFTSSDKLVTLICYFLGIIILIFGIFNLIKYYKVKKELKIDDNTSLIIGGTLTFVGLLTIILASAIEVGIRYIIGFILLYSGFQKITFALASKNYIILIEGLIFIILGLYSILAQNIVFTIIGLLLIISSIMDLIEIIFIKKSS